MAATAPRILKNTVSYGLLILLALFLIAPFAWMVLVSLHESKAPIPPIEKIVPTQAHWENYRTVLFMSDIPVLRFFLNSLIVTVGVVVGQLFVTSLAAYGFARMQFKGRDAIFYLFLLSLMFAGPVTQLPVYLLVRNLGWLDTYAALIVPGISSAFNVFLLRQFFMQIPRELDEAARIDGAGDFRIYSRVILPLSRAALATAGAFTFFAVWTDFFWPLLATSSMEMRTLEVGLSVFKNSYGATNWPLQMTAAVIVLMPLLVLFLFTQRYFVKGITMGSIK
ncbi:MAG: carbohydrate ABC transporter permease [Fimbriimonadaceae bacterium]|nr:carbohydrate ABC transporter permease [Fimbriimonadaceae bacterium]